MNNLGFAARLRDLRIRAGVSQYRLAQRSGLSRQEISHLESGKRPTPSWETVCKLADGLGIDVNEFRKDH